MASSEPIQISGNSDIDALLTVDAINPTRAYRWDTNSLTYSFPDDGYSYIFEQFFDIADVEVLDAFTAALTAALLVSPVGAPLSAIAIPILISYLTNEVVYSTIAAGFQKFNEAQQNSARFAMGQYEAVSGLNLTEQTEGLIFDHADIRFAETAFANPAFGIPPLPMVELLLGEAVLGDTWFKDDGRFNAPSPGNYADFTILHEAGHALGLKHAHEDGLLGARVPEWLEESLTGVEGPIV